MRMGIPVFVLKYLSAVPGGGYHEKLALSAGSFPAGDYR